MLRADQIGGWVKSARSPHLGSNSSRFGVEAPATVERDSVGGGWAPAEDLSAVRRRGGGGGYGEVGPSAPSGGGGRGGGSERAVLHAGNRCASSSHAAPAGSRMPPRHWSAKAKAASASGRSVRRSSIRVAKAAAADAPPAEEAEEPHSPWLGFGVLRRRSAFPPLGKARWGASG
jgi:hypothetical protein